MSALIFIAVFAIFQPVASLAQGVNGASTRTVSGSQAGPFSVTFIKDYRDSRLETNFSLKWDFKDVKNVYPGMIRFVSNPVSLFKNASWDIVDNATVRLYGLTINPWKVLIEPEPAVSTSAYSNGGGRNGSGNHRKFRISLMPIIEDMRRDLPEGMRRGLLEGSFRYMPQGQNLDYQGKKAVVKDVLSLYDSWGLPGGFDLPRSGLKYLIEEPGKGVKTSTQPATTNPK